MACDVAPNLLVVEDDEDDFLLVQDLLHHEMAAEGQQAKSVDEALERLDQAAFDAILLDYGLGAKNGLDLLDELRQRENVTPVIFLTGHGGEEIAVRALKSGAVDYLSKTKITAERLATAVRHALAIKERDAAVRAAREALSARERDYRSLFEKTNDAILIIDPGTEIILEANPAALRLYACGYEQVIGKSLIEFSTDIVRGREAIEHCLRCGDLSNFETVHVARDGRHLDLLVNASMVEYRGKAAMLATCRDISERKADEREIFRLNRALKALSKCNEALWSAHNAQQFLDEICRIVVQVAGYAMGWVAGAPAGEEEAIRPLAWAGATGNYVHKVCERYRDPEIAPSLLVPTAMRTGAPAVCRDTCAVAYPMRKECEELGFGSILALPLHANGAIVGALAICAGERDAFDNAEVELLNELATNVSYGIESIEARRQREAAQGALRASEEYLRNLIETANEGIWTINAEERTTFVNAKMAAMLGRGPEEMLGAWAGDFSDPSQHDLLRESMQEMRASVRKHYEIILIRKDGTRIVTSLNSSPIVNGEGEYAGALAMVSDITEQKQAEEKLRESELRYRTLFERNLAGVFRARADGSLLEANDAFVRMLGYADASEVRDLKLPELCAASGCVERWCEALVRSGQLVNQEISLLRKDGSTAYLLANLVSLRDGGGAAEFIEGTVLDVTERRQLQVQLLQSQKMDAIGQLAGGIAHDFNNLLMVMRSYAEMAAESAGDDAVRRQLDAIVKAADRGAVLTRQLLTFGRKQTFAPRVMDLNTVLENITKVLPRALGEDVRVELHGAAGLWQVKADPVQIEQLVLNLAVNARDAMPEGGRLTLETQNVELDASYVKLHADVPPGDYVLLAISDTGHGIAPEILPRIFEPFFTTKERGKGTGLGLATVYGIVRQCAGFVWVYSEPGHGTIFKIYLPRANATGSVAAADAAAGERPTAGSETILLVEDEEAVRSVARSYLEGRGYHVIEAASGEEALRCSGAHEGALDLLITDAVMPGMNGLVLAQKLVQLRPELRVLCVSGYTEASMAAHGVNMTTAFLQKPFSLAVLARKVRDLLDQPPTRLEQPEQFVA